MKLFQDFKQAALISETSVSLFQATAMCHHRYGVPSLSKGKQAAGVSRCIQLEPHSEDRREGWRQVNGGGHIKHPPIDSRTLSVAPLYLLRD